MTDIKPQEVIAACHLWIDTLNKVEGLEVCDECYQCAMMSVDIAYAEYLKLVTAYKAQIERDQKLHQQIVDEVAELLGTKEAGNE